MTPDKKKLDINIKQGDLFSNKKVKEASLNQDKRESSDIIEEATTKVDSEISDSYIPVALCTIGKLSAPAILHFRNYTLEDAAELTDFSEENQYEIFIKILNRCVHEEFDCGMLNRQEVLHILLSIYGAWWSPILERQYLIDETLKGEKLQDKKNIGYARIRIAEDIVVDDLLTEFKTPFKITGPKGIVYELRLPVVKDLVFAKKFIETKYAEEEKLFSVTKRAILNGEEKTISAEDLKDYRDFMANKLKEGLLIERSGMLVSKNGEVLSDQEKFELAKALPLDFWSLLGKLQKDLEFGINTEISFYNEQKKSVTRRFQFRFIDLFPPMESESLGGYKLSFD